jgi:hypothetical protein
MHCHVWLAIFFFISFMTSLSTFFCGRDKSWVRTRGSAVIYNNLTIPPKTTTFTHSPSIRGTVTEYLCVNAT